MPHTHTPIQNYCPPPLSPTTDPNKQEEVEQAELEQAIAMSLALEAKRVEHAMLQEDSGVNGGETCSRRGTSGQRSGNTPTGSDVSHNCKEKG